MNINPSSQGWIDKYFTLSHKFDFTNLEDEELHKQLRNSGFIYGHTIKLYSLEYLTLQKLTTEEITKLTLLHSLYIMFVKVRDLNDSKEFLKELLKFYSALHPEPKNFLNRFLPKEKESIRLEKIISIRVTTNDSFFTKSFSHIITNAFLYMDVLAFRKYLLGENQVLKYLEKIEKVVTKIAFVSLDAKSKKSKYDSLLIKLFENSVRFSKFEKNHDTVDVNLEYFDSNFERNYFLDISCMSMWSDKILERRELDFIKSFAFQLKIESYKVDEAIESIFYFINTYKNQIPYFNYSNPVKHFYDHTSNTVVNLILRNKDRLIKEILASGELVKLLALSTQRNLDEQERKKVKKQLIEICKTIPSLAIFALPGGSLLLPILIKFVPTFMPVSFNENFADDELK